MEILALIIPIYYFIVLLNVLLFLYIALPRDNSEIKSGTVERVKLFRFLVLFFTFINFTIFVFVVSLISPAETLDYIIAVIPVGICLILSIFAIAKTQKLEARAKSLGI